jgi:hypothetical protein
LNRRRRFNRGLPGRVARRFATFADAGDEAIATARDGFDVLGFARRFAERLANHENGDGQIALFDVTVGPDLFDQFVFLKQATAILNEGQEQIKRLGSERDRAPVAQQQAFRQVDRERAEFIEAAGLTTHDRFNNSLIRI